MFDQPLAFVDLETTGANPLKDRATEVAIVRVEPDGRVEEWSSLVNPEAPIPRLIQGFTGITDEMVRDAPRFGQLADEIRARLEGAVFIAHNARFDYGFLKNEFRRIEQPFQARVLCTVKLSRALYPEHHRHGLDALIARHGLACAARHRALGDAQVLWAFMQLVRREFDEAVIQRAVGKALKTPSLPPGLPEGSLEALPHAPGVYLFFGENDLPIYIGKSVNIASRVRAHFSADHRNGKEMELAQQVRRIEWVETAGDLGASLLEARLIKERQPTHNRRLRRQGELCSWRLTGHPSQPVSLVYLDDAPTADEPLYGLFPSKKEAGLALRQLAELHQLCLKRLGLEAGKGACFGLQLRKCKGVCAGKEHPMAHDLRLHGALGSLRLAPWPFPGPVAVREAAPDGARTDVHLLDRWCHLGSARTEADFAELCAEPGRPVFDPDIYKILRRELAAAEGRWDIQPLTPQPAPAD